MRFTRTVAVFGLLAGVVLTGCSTSTAPVTLVDFQPIPLEVAAPELAAAFAGSAPPVYVSLGAGDALGRAVYVNNIILAARQRTENLGTAVADVPTDEQ